MTNNVVKTKILQNNYNIITARSLARGRRLLFVFVFVPATAVVSCSLVPRTAAARRAAGSMSRGGGGRAHARSAAAAVSDAEELGHSAAAAVGARVKNRTRSSGRRSRSAVIAAVAQLLTRCAWTV